MKNKTTSDKFLDRKESMRFAMATNIKKLQSY